MKKIIADIFISADNKLFVRIKDKQTHFVLSNYSFDITKSFAETNNLFVDEKLVTDVQAFLKPNISRLWFISSPLTLYVSIAKFCDQNGFNHILNFADVLGGNIIELAYIKTTNNDIPDRQAVLSNRVARRNCNVGQGDTQFFDIINAH